MMMMRLVRRRNMSILPPPPTSWDCRTILPWIWSDKRDVPLTKEHCFFVGGAIVLLNSPSPLPSFFPLLWSSPSFLACSDGASNTLVQHCSPQPSSFFSLPPPHLIIGDMDSATPSTLRMFESTNVTSIVRRPNQDTTDFHKLLHHPAIEDRAQNSLCVVGALQGFVSHEVSNWHTALTYLQKRTSLPPVFFLDQSQLCMPLRPGKTTFTHCPPRQSMSLLPIYGPVSQLNTTGLKWDLKNSLLSMDTLVSSSNEASHHIVTIDTSHYLLCTFDHR